MKKYEHRIEILKDAQLLAEHGMIDVAISLIDEAFENYLEFYAFYLTETNEEYAIFDIHFVEWCAKVMTLIYNGKCSSDEQVMVNLTAQLLNL